jgi:hypothetical protein
MNKLKLILLTCILLLSLPLIFFGSIFINELIQNQFISSDASKFINYYNSNLNSQLDSLEYFRFGSRIRKYTHFRKADKDTVLYFDARLDSSMNFIINNICRIGIIKGKINNFNGKVEWIREDTVLNSDSLIFYENKILLKEYHIYSYVNKLNGRKLFYFPKATLYYNYIENDVQCDKSIYLKKIKINNNWILINNMNGTIHEY